MCADEGMEKVDGRGRIRVVALECRGQTSVRVFRRNGSERAKGRSLSASSCYEKWLGFVGWKQFEVRTLDSL